MSSQRIGSILVATSLALAGTVLLPWARSGQVSRSGWDIVGSARRLGVVDSGLAEGALVVFFAVPALAFVVLLLHTLGHRRFSGAVAMLMILTTLLVAVAVALSPLEPRWGLWLNMGVAAADGVLVGWLIISIRGRGDEE